ncbi:hypothetical protein BDU57DRAFT_535317 [Ampelomyces quisqualis]|uniref:CorA-like transporter domain-containing protein n=1 Tax=Ampelomyces quisqualis TaxID=50730 RepID=A0A6A5R2R7_AMPQU|nr:hypothetical protein BDU57DRAFT_535317 [Ampelomyces quisqualis]
MTASLLLSQPDSVTEEFYEREVGSIFETETENFRVEVRCRQTQELSAFEKEAPAAMQHASTTVEKSATSVDKASCVLHIFDLNLDKVVQFFQATHNLSRVLYVRHYNSHRCLQISKELFSIFVQQCGIFPHLCEFLVDFKSKMRETEVGPPRIKFRSTLPHNGSFGTTGSGFECAYVVRFTELTNREGNYPWSLMQYVVYHKYRVVDGSHCSTWILFGSSHRSERYFNQYLNDFGDTHRSSPFEMHVRLLGVAIASWRPYLINLNDKITEMSEKAHLMQTGKGGRIAEADIDYVDEYQSLKDNEDRAADILLCLDSTLDTITTLKGIYLQDLRSSSTSLAEPTQRDDELLFAFDEKLKDVAYAHKKVEALLIKAQNTRALISSLLERLNGYNLDQQMIVFENIQKQAHDEDTIMRELAEQCAHDFAGVKILAIIILIYISFMVTLLLLYLIRKSR